MSSGLYFWMICMGVVSVLCAFLILRKEMKQRSDFYRQQLHTQFSIFGSTQVVDLARTHYVIGRRKRRCDICLDQLKDDHISKVHAVLWHDGRSFCIAPHYGKSGSDKKKRYTTILINGTPVPPQGRAVRYGDMIRMGNHRFMLIDTRRRTNG